MSPETRRQLSDLFERLANLELANLEGKMPRRQLLVELSKIRMEFYRILKEST